MTELGNATARAGTAKPAGPPLLPSGDAVEDETVPDGELPGVLVFLLLNAHRREGRGRQN